MAEPRVVAFEGRPGLYIEDEKAPGRWRLMTENEAAQYYIDANVPPQAIGTKPPEGEGELSLRWVVKNFGNPESAKKEYEKRGYTVMPFGKGFNFAYWRPGMTKWEILDDPRFNTKDWLDLVYDVVSGAGVEAAGLAGGAGMAALSAASGNPLMMGAAGMAGQFAGRGVGGLAAEVGRDLIGKAMGLEQDVDWERATAAGALSATAPPVLGTIGRAGARSLRAFGRGIGHVGGFMSDLGAKAVDVPPAAGMSPGQVLRARAKMEPVANLPEPAEVAKVLREHSTKVLTKRLIPELQQAESMLRDAAARGASVADMSDVFNEFGRRTIMEVGTTPGATGARLTPADRKSIQLYMMELLADLARLRGVPDESLAEVLSNRAARAALVREVPLDIAEELSKRLGAEVRRGKEGAGFFVQTPLGKAAQDADAVLNRKINDTMGGEFVRLRQVGGRKKDVATFIRDKVGTEMEPKFSAESFIKNIYGAGKTEIREALEEYDKLFSTTFTDLAEKSAIGSAFPATATSAFGDPTANLRLTATGSVLGLSALDQISGGYLTPDNPAIAIPLVLGAIGTLGTQKGQVGVARQLGRLGAGLSGGASTVASSDLANFAMPALQGMASRNLVNSAAIEELNERIRRDIMSRSDLLTGAP